MSGLFLVGYGALRFIAEYAREPDNFLGLLALGFTMGQWLSLPMIVIGVAMMVWAYRRAGKARADAARPDEVAVASSGREPVSRAGGNSPSIVVRRRACVRPAPAGCGSVAARD